MSPPPGRGAGDHDQGEPGDVADTVPWRAFLAEATERLAAAGVASPAAEARWLVEEASGHEGSDLAAGLDEPATQRGVARFDRMLARREAGEPLQHVLGHWAFRHLDLLVDGRVLIPRPETEVVVEVALAELDALGPPDGRPRRAVDLGTGSGAIGLSLAAERTGLEVWITDVSTAALDVARANLAGIGRAGARVRVAEGSWYDALPPELAGEVDLIVSNPPYVAPHDELPAEVRDHEPALALVPGPTGLEALHVVVDGAGAWLAPGGVVVVELAPGQAVGVAERAVAAGLVDVRVEPDLVGRDRMVVARRPG
ncbi:MAG: peptide chain release factor N(5)-glutamine methyltransferase [Acidimicrobiales bacterium]